MSGRRADDAAAGAGSGSGGGIDIAAATATTAGVEAGACAAAGAAVPDEGVLDLMLWSRFFSPLVDDADRGALFAALGLGDFAPLAADYWGMFHAGAPQPPLPLLVHVVLQLDGGDLREDLVRVMEFLELDWAGATLPPDHLAIMLELLAVAQQEDEPVICEGLRVRWLLPWAEAAVAQARGTAWEGVLQRLSGDLREGAPAR